MSTDDGRRARLQQRLEQAAALGEIDINEYDELCATIWNVENAEESPALDAIAGRLERLEGNRRTHGGAGYGNAGPSGHGGSGYGNGGPTGHGIAGPSGNGDNRPANPYGSNPYGAVGPGPSRGGAHPPEASFGRGNVPARFTVSNLPEHSRQDGKATIFGEKTFAGSWAPKNETTWWSTFGELNLDLTRADLPSHRIVLDLQAFFSEIVITVPFGTSVALDVSTPMTDVVNHLNPNAEPNGLTVVIEGIAMFCELKVSEG